MRVLFVILLALEAIPAPLLAQLPIITNQPASRDFWVGGKVVFAVGISNATSFTYQWQHDNTNLPNNIITTVAGNTNQGYAGDGGSAINASLASPYAVALDAGGELFIADHGNGRIRRVDTNGIITTITSVSNPIGVTVDGADNVFTDGGAGSTIIEVNQFGNVVTVAGNGTLSYSGDGGAATNAGLYWPYGVTVDNHGRLLIADLFNNRIRAVATGGVITTVAGIGPTGTGSYSGDGGAATNAKLYYPYDIAVDSSSNIFIADQYNHRIRKVDPSGIITTVAGNGTHAYSGDDGAATNASLNYPSGVSVDSVGNLYIADGDNQRVRRVGTNGIIKTIAGDGTYSYAGDGGAATNANLADPCSVAVDAAGNVFVADRYNNRIRKVTNTQGPLLALDNASALDAGVIGLLRAAPTEVSPAASPASSPIHRRSAQPFRFPTAPVNSHSRASRVQPMWFFAPPILPLRWFGNRFPPMFLVRMPHGNSMMTMQPVKPSSIALFRIDSRQSKITKTVREGCDPIFLETF